MNSARNWMPLAIVGIFLAATGWALSFGTLPPADFTFCNGTEIKTVDPAIVQGVPEGRIISEIFEGLVKWDPKDLHPIPGVAERWELSDDRRIYTFHLRANALWSNGRPVTADDFRYSFRRLLDPLMASEYSYQLGYVKNATKYNFGPLEPGDAVEVELKKPAGAKQSVRGEILRGKLLAKLGEDSYEVEIAGQPQRYKVGGGAGFTDIERVLFDFNEVGIRVVDPRTLVIELTNPTPYFLALTGFYPLFPVNRECVEEHDYPLWTKPENIVTNGPYHLAARRIRDRIRLVKSETYWNRDQVQLNVVDALAVSTQATMLNLYLTGEADWIHDVPNTVIPELLRTRPSEFQPTPMLGIYFYRINVNRPPLDRPEIRRALGLALDRKELVEKVTRTGEIPASSLVPPGIVGYEPARCGEFNPDEARKILADAGYPGGKGFPKIEVLYNSHDTHKAIAELIQNQWKRNLGIDVGLRNQEWSVQLASQRQLDYSVSRSAWIGDYLDPNTFIDMFVTDGANNQTGWSNAEYDRLVRAAAIEADPAKRFETLRQAEAILMREMPIVPIYYYVSKDMVRPWVRGFYHNVRDFHPLSALSIDEDAKQRAHSGEADQ